MSESTGQKLRQAREARSMGIEQVANATHIRVHYLKAMEADHFEALPSQAQARGFLRAYASYLGLNTQSLMAELALQNPGMGGKPPASPSSSTAGPQSAQPAGFSASPETPPMSPAASAAQNDFSQSNAIFVEIGQKLRTQRELLGLTYDDVERHTHLRRHFLEALEAGDLSILPSPVQGRGMLNNYASFLGIDPEPILLRFAEGLQSRLSARQEPVIPGKRRTAARKPAAKPSFARRLFSTDLILGGFIVIFLIGFIAWGAFRILALGTGGTGIDTTATPLSISDVLLGGTGTPAESEAAATGAVAASSETSVPSSAPIADSGTVPAAGVTQANDATLPASGPTPGTGAIQLYVVVRERTYMKVIVDGTVAFSGRAASGGAYTYAGEKRIEILTSNGAALQVFYNQLDQGLMGAYGEVVNRIYTLQGVQTPTATMTPTGRPAPTSTSAPTGTITGTPGKTPTATGTPAASITP